MNRHQQSYQRFGDVIHSVMTAFLTGDYLEQLTYLIFLKMSDEYSRPPYKETGIPAGYTWSDMNTLKGCRTGRTVQSYA